jgi:hypothetical protein
LDSKFITGTYYKEVGTYENDANWEQQLYADSVNKIQIMEGN